MKITYLDFQVYRETVFFNDYFQQPRITFIAVLGIKRGLILTPEGNE